MNVDLTVLGQLVALSMVVFSVGLGTMARHRNLSAVGWALLGLIPIVNLVSWIVLLRIRNQSPEPIGQK